jgi:hypothetical protein
VLDHSRRGTLGDVNEIGVRGTGIKRVALSRALASERSWVRVEPEAYLAAALIDERCQPVGERGRDQAIVRAAGLLARAAAPALDLLLQAGAGREARHLAAGDEDPLPGPRVDALPGATLRDGELSEASEIHLTPALENVGDCVEHSVDGLARLLLVADSAVAREHVKELSLCHVFSS